MINRDQLIANVRPKITSLRVGAEEVSMLAMPLENVIQSPESLLIGPAPATPSVVLIEPVGASLPNRQSLLSNESYRVTPVRDTRGLSLLGTNEVFTLAVISDALGHAGLVDAARSVRRQWPTARILVLGRAALVLDDNLYDDTFPHSCGQQELCNTLTRMLSQQTQGRPFLLTTPASELDFLQRQQVATAADSRMPGAPERMPQMQSRI